MRVLVATGGSGHSDLALQLANAFAQAMGAEGTILHVARRAGHDLPELVERPVPPAHQRDRDSSANPWAPSSR